MTLNEFCTDSWVKTKDGYYVSKHCCEAKIDLYLAIVRWQLRQRDKFSSSENDTLMKCLICGVARNRAVWWEIKKFLHSYHLSRYAWEDGLSECFQILFEKNLSYLLSFDLKKVEFRDNKNVMKQLSGYIARCLYPRDILKLYLGTRFEVLGDDEPADPVITIDPEVWEKISDYIFSLFEKAYNEITIYAFVHEALSARQRKSDLARQHKIRLKEYIRKYLEKNEHEKLEPLYAGMITDYIEENLINEAERRSQSHTKYLRRVRGRERVNQHKTAIQRIKSLFEEVWKPMKRGQDIGRHSTVGNMSKLKANEHKIAIQRIKSLFEEAQKHLKLDNFISENKACFDEKITSLLCKYEKAELIKFISQRLNHITENIIYFRDITPKYIADDIGRMICEKEFSV